MKLNSIQSRLMGVAFISIMGISVAMGLMGIRVTTDFLRGRFHEHFRLLAAYTASNAELGVLIRDTAMLDRLARNTLVQEEVRGVIITSHSGKTLSRAKKGEVSEQIREVIAPIVAAQMDEEGLLLSSDGRPERVGTVAIQYSVKGLEELIRAMALRFLVMSVFLAFASALVYWLLSRSIVAPLNHLVDVARTVSRGEMEVRASGGSLVETRTLSSTFNDMLDALKRRETALEDAYAKMSRQEALAEVGKFSMMVAHEVKNPLTIIQGSIDALKKRDIEPETARTLLTFVEEEVQRINRLTEDFLVFARPSEPRLCPIEMNGLIRALVAKIELMTHRDADRIRYKIMDLPCVCACDAALMERAIGNIVNNGLDACGPQGLVEITSSLANGFWSLKVRDTGPGVPPENLAKIFEPFFTTKAKGAGLGLAMAKRIVEAHGGKIVMRNHNGGGACVVIELPKANLSAEECRGKDEEKMNVEHRTSHIEC